MYSLPTRPLGRRAATEKGLTSISQKTLTETLARRFDVTTTPPCPASPCANLGARVEDESGGTWLYKEAVRGLMWLVVMSRPDITNAVRAVSRHSNSPAEIHWKVVLQIIRYLLGTKDLSLTFEWGSGLEISVFADANYAQKADDRRSVSGVAVTVGKSSVSWFSSTQKIVTLSTIEAKYIAHLGWSQRSLVCEGSSFFHHSIYLRELHQGIRRQRWGNLTCE